MIAWLKNWAPPLWLPFVLVAAVIGAIWLLMPQYRAETGVSAPLPPAKEVRTVEKVIEVPKLVYVYPPKAKAKLDLPADVAKDPAKKVTATGKLDANDRPHTLTTVFDMETGESEIYARPDPLPWLAKNTTSELGVFIGYRGIEQAIRIEGRQEFLRIKALHIGAIGSADITPGEIDGFVGFGAWGRW